jgi:hypothetical protein
VPVAAPEPGAHRQHGQDIGAPADVAPLAYMVAAQEVAGLVRDDAGDLRLVAHPG